MKTKIDSRTVEFIIPGDPVGKPRMTRRDKWAQRKCVSRYWAWCDKARQAAFGDPSTKRTLDAPTSITVVAYFYHKTRRGPHLLKPDGDNILKSVCDALFVNDEMIYIKTVEKYWASYSSRVVVEWDCKQKYPADDDSHP